MFDGSENLNLFIGEKFSHQSSLYLPIPYAVLESLRMGSRRSRDDNENHNEETRSLGTDENGTRYFSVADRW